MVSLSWDFVVMLDSKRRDFVSAHTLRVEFGLANEMDQLDRNYKVRQLMGAPIREPSGLPLSQFERIGK
jgi:hypothetical protein